MSAMFLRDFMSLIRASVREYCGNVFHIAGELDFIPKLAERSANYIYIGLRRSLVNRSTRARIRNDLGPPSDDPFAIKGRAGEMCHD
jgi:hypothetical protein